MRYPEIKAIRVRKLRTVALTVTAMMALLLTGCTDKLSTDPTPPPTQPNPAVQWERYTECLEAAGQNWNDIEGCKHHLDGLPDRDSIGWTTEGN